MDINKSNVQLKVNDKNANAYLASPKNGGSGILVLHAWWGLKPFFKQVCDQLAEHGYTALALDYYNGRIGNTIEETQTLQQEVEGDPSVMSEMVKAAKDHLGFASTRQADWCDGLFDGHGLGGDDCGKRAGYCRDSFILWRLQSGFQQSEIESARSLCSETDEWDSFERARTWNKK